MSLAALHLTWDGDPANDVLPRRPSTDDLGGDEKVDDIDFPPDDTEHPTAAGWNQLVRQVAALARGVASLKFEVQYEGNTPFLARLSGPRSALAAEQFSIIEVSPGVVDVNWPANFFPPHQCAPTGLTLLSDSSSLRSGQVFEIPNGVRVRTFQSGSPGRVAFSLTIN